MVKHEVVSMVLETNKIVQEGRRERTYTSRERNHQQMAAGRPKSPTANKQSIDAT